MYMNLIAKAVIIAFDIILQLVHASNRQWCSTFFIYCDGSDDSAFMSAIGISGLKCTNCIFFQKDRGRKPLTF